ncbi:MAG: response regulator [Candidatus Zixiibacteriota bacterium]
MHTTPVVDAVNMICDNARATIVQSTPASRKAMEDFLLAARVNRALVEEGHDVAVTSRDGDVTVAINKYVLRLDHLREQFRKVGARVAGVKSVQVREQPDLRASLVMSNQEFDLPAKVLLIDDEKEFVQTLSERLQMRDIGTAVVFDGEQALSVIDKEEPEVMILDLRMPGIDGIEVLRRVKQTRPQVEIIILTGHGSEKDRELAMSLGAFAYLEKPVDIQNLTNVLRDAYERIKRNQKLRESPGA